MIYNGINKPPLGIKLNRTHRLSKGLVGCWLFNEGGGNKAYDLSGYGNHGTLENMAFPSTAALGWNPGKTGVGLNFDGTSSHVDCGNDPSLGFGTGAFTISMWIKPAITLPSSYNTMFSYGGSNGHFVFGQQMTTGYLYLYANDGLQIADTVALDAGNWYNVVLVGSGGTGGNIKLYKNNVLIGTWTTDYNYPQDNIWIGSNEDAPTTDGFDGSKDGIMIYNRALSAFEIRELYRDPYAMFEVDDSWVLWAGKIKTPLGTNIAAAKLLL